MPVRTGQGNRVSSPPAPPPLPPAPPPTPRPVLAWRTALWPPGTYLRGHLFLHAAAFTVVAAHMALFPALYTPHTWRGLLFIIAWAPPWKWAIVFAALAALKLTAAIFYPKLALPALIGGAVVLIWWAVGLTFAAFAAPNGDDMRATIIPAVLAVLCFLEHFAALSLMDGRRRWGDS